jgi:hypothetical protein
MAVFGKVCSECNLEKSVTSFQTKGADFNSNKQKARRGVCRSCRRRRSVLLGRERFKARAIDYLGGKCRGANCVFAGNPIDPVLFDFHHVDGSVKSFNVSAVLSCMHKGGWTKVKNELDKCILLCCVCHRLLHKSENTRTSVM